MMDEVLLSFLFSIIMSIFIYRLWKKHASNSFSWTNNKNAVSEKILIYNYRAGETLKKL